MNFKKGFTLVELLIVIGVIAVLAALAFVALNPLARFQDSRNAQRWTDVNAIIDAIKLHQIDNDGIYLSVLNGLTADMYYHIGQGEACNNSCRNPGTIMQATCVDIEELMDLGYLQTIPYDPSQVGADMDHSYYYLVRLSNGSVEVGSCSEEIGSAPAIPAIQIRR